MSRQRGKGRNPTYQKNRFADKDRDRNAVEKREKVEQPQAQELNLAKINAEILIRVEDNDIKLPLIESDEPISVSLVLGILEKAKQAVLSVPYVPEE